MSNYICARWARMYCIGESMEGSWVEFGGIGAKLNSSINSRFAYIYDQKAQQAIMQELVTKCEGSAIVH